MVVGEVAHIRLALEHLVLEALTRSKELPDLAKLIYLHVHCSRPQSITQLEGITGYSVRTVQRACHALEEAGWIKAVRVGRTKQLVEAIPNKVQEQLKAYVEEGYSMARHKGEFLARSWLDITIASTSYVDNARPQFLINPSTGEPLEYDRYYPSPANVAFEFNGLQHYGPTDKYRSEEDFRSTRIRDLIKRALSDENGVTLVVLTHKDLSLNRIMSSIPDMLEKTWVDSAGPLIQTLERLSTQYRAKVEKAEAQRAKAGRTK